MDSRCLFPVPWMGRAACSSRRRREKSVIRIQERRIVFNDSPFAYFRGLPARFVQAIRTPCERSSVAVRRFAWSRVQLPFRPIEAQSALKVRVYATGLISPVAFVQDPTNSSVQFVVEQGGRIRVIQIGVVQPTDFLGSAGCDYLRR